MKQYIIGVDVGGTNTDIALLDTSGRLIASCKEPTSAPVHSAIQSGVMKVLLQAKVLPGQVYSLAVGTTHALNALLEAKGLSKVALIRVASNNPLLKPCAGWSQNLKEAVLLGYETVQGGYECDGSPIDELNINEAKDAIRRLIDKGAQNFAVSSPFSCLQDKQEQEMKELIQKELSCVAPLDSCTITLSSEIGGIGFIERENSALLNSALSCVIKDAFQSIESSLQKIGILCPILMVINDGSAHPLHEVAESPILTIASGQANSARGGSLLYATEASSSVLIVDIGGTSTDCIPVKSGYVRRHTGLFEIQGAKMQFPAPQMHSISLGGGSIVKRVHHQVTVGPHSVAKKIRSEALSFGGSMLTMTDIAEKMGLLDLSQQEGYQPINIDIDIAESALQRAADMALQAIIRAKGSETDMPIGFVGGGSPIVYEYLKKRIPLLELCPHYDVANAIGAALSERVGIVDTIVSLRSRDETIDKLSELALQKAIEKGACHKKVTVKDLQIIPFGYSSDQKARVIITASGPAANMEISLRK